jgi:hypothetical protein
VADAHVRVFDAAIMGVVDDEDVIGDFSHAATLRSNERNGAKAVFFGPLEGFDAVGGIAADAHAESDVTGLAVVLQLAEENVFIGIVIGQGGHPAHVVVEGEDAEAFVELVGGAFAKVSGEVRGVCRAAAIAEYEELAVFFVGRAEEFDELGHGVHGDGVVSGFLGADIIRNPLFHARAGCGKRGWLSGEMWAVAGT